ncbi:hypothetical protein JL721_7146 [Aureococcus anophagefferens]|nr:hypothetical protein JL721_7146 [Aureococcus anophagefferens]
MGMHFDLRPMTPEERASGLVAVEWESEADDGSVVSALEDVGSVANRSYGATQNLECLRDDEMTVSSEVEGRVGKCERSCERLARDMKTVWTLERAFEGRMSEHVKGWGDEIAHMRDSVVEEIQDGQAAIVAEGVAGPKAELVDARLRLDAAEAAQAVGETRVGVVEEQISVLASINERLVALEKRAERAERRAARAETLFDRRCEDIETFASQLDEWLTEVVARIKRDSRRIDAADRRAAPVHRALAKLSNRIAAAVMIDEAARRAAEGDREGARELRSSFVSGDHDFPDFETASKASLLHRLSRVGSCGGESLAVQHGLQLDAASEGSSREEEVRRKSVIATPGGLRRASSIPAIPRAADDFYGPPKAKSVEAPPPEPPKPTAPEKTGLARDVANVLGHVLEGGLDGGGAAGAPAPAAADGDADPDEPRVLIKTNTCPTSIWHSTGLFDDDGDDADDEPVVVESFPETIVADAVLAILRRVSGIEAGKAEKSQLRVYETGITNNRNRIESSEKRLEYRVANDESRNEKAFADLNEGAEHLNARLENEQERITSVSQQIESLRRMFQQLNIDNIGAVREFLAPTLDKVDVIAEDLQRVTEETGFKLSDLERTKATTEALMKKADMDVVEDKATTFHVDNVASSVTALSLTIGSLAERIIHSEGMAQRSAETAQKLEVLIIQLRKHILENEDLNKLKDAGGASPKQHNRRRLSAGTPDQASPKATYRKQTPSRHQSFHNSQKLAPIPRDGDASGGDEGPHAIPAFPGANHQPPLVPPGVALHKHRMSWKSPAAEHEQAHEARHRAIATASENRRKKPAKTALTESVRSSRPESAPLSPWTPDASDA